MSYAPFSSFYTEDTDGPPYMAYIEGMFCGLRFHGTKMIFHYVYLFEHEHYKNFVNDLYAKGYILALGDTPDNVVTLVVREM